jgi:hypothetical protein
MDFFYITIFFIFVVSILIESNIKKKENFNRNRELGNTFTEKNTFLEKIIWVYTFLEKSIVFRETNNWYNTNRRNTFGIPFIRKDN